MRRVPVPDAYRGLVCVHGDRRCPCNDGDACHYEPHDGTPAAPCPRSGRVGCDCAGMCHTLLIRDRCIRLRCPCVLPVDHQPPHKCAHDLARVEAS